jgi:hypothetical protein
MVTGPHRPGTKRAPRDPGLVGDRGYHLVGLRVNLYEMPLRRSNAPHGPLAERHPATARANVDGRDQRIGLGVNPEETSVPSIVNPNGGVVAADILRFAHPQTGDRRTDGSGGRQRGGRRVALGLPASLVLEPQAANTSTHSNITIQPIIRCLMSMTPCASWHGRCATVSLVRTRCKGHSSCGAVR